MRYARARLGMHFGTVLAVLYPSIYKYVNMIHLKQDSLWVIKIYRRESFGRQKERRKKSEKETKRAKRWLRQPKCTISQRNSIKFSVAWLYKGEMQYEI